ncbi:MAG TPA: histidine kinase [Gemmatimonadaceae bacterium]|nr:histidine kinase [Gemmatimonadaceae bacterium]
MRFRQSVRPWMVVSAVWVGPAVLAAINQVAQRRLHGDPPASLRELLWTGGDWLVYAFLTPAIFWVSSRWPIERPHLARRAALHLTISLLLSAAWAIGGKVLEAALAAVLTPGQMEAAMAAAGDQLWHKVSLDVVGWIFITLPFGMVVYLSVMAMAHGIRYFVQAREREVQLARLSEQLAGAQYAALQARLNPHFLFNTLNTIAVRARDGDGAGTARMVEQLSEVLRRTLSRDRVNEVTLEEELELVQEYLAIEQARFSDRLRPTFEVADTMLSAAVPSFALQHLVENAIRHGIAKRSGAGRVTVLARRDGDTLELSVIDEGPGIDERITLPKGHGIENTRERLQALYGEGASLVVSKVLPAGTMATLRIPYREMALETDVAER